jgi:hypothetical protein
MVYTIYVFLIVSFMEGLKWCHINIRAYVAMIPTLVYLQNINSLSMGIHICLFWEPPGCRLCVHVQKQVYVELRM